MNPYIVDSFSKINLNQQLIGNGANNQSNKSVLAYNNL